MDVSSIKHYSVTHRQGHSPVLIPSPGPQSRTHTIARATVPYSYHPQGHSPVLIPSPGPQSRTHTIARATVPYSYHRQGHGPVLIPSPGPQSHTHTIPRATVPYSYLIPLAGQGHALPDLDRPEGSGRRSRNRAPCSVPRGSGLRHLLAPSPEEGQGEQVHGNILRYTVSILAIMN